RGRLGRPALGARALVRHEPCLRAPPLGPRADCFNRAHLARASTPHPPRLHSPALLPGDDDSGTASSSARGQLGRGVLDTDWPGDLDALRDRASPYLTPFPLTKFSVPH